MSAPGGSLARRGERISLKGINGLTPVLLLRLGAKATTQVKATLIANIEAAVAASRTCRSNIIVDGPEPALSLVAFRGHGRWSLVRRRPNGSRCKIIIGSWPDMGPEQAAELARKEKVRFAGEHGVSLVTLTLASVLALYLEERVSRLRSAASTRRSLNLALRDLADHDLRLITGDEVEGVLAKVAETSPIHANRCLAYIRAFFNWAVDRRFIGSF